MTVSESRCESPAATQTWWTLGSPKVLTVLSKAEFKCRSDLLSLFTADPIKALHFAILVEPTIFTARRYSSAVLAVIVCLSIRPSVRLSD